MDTGSKLGDITNIIRNIVSASDDVSKVVDENGEPMVVYHYSNNPNITIFNPFRRSTDLSKEEFERLENIKNVYNDGNRSLIRPFMGIWATPIRGEYADYGKYEYALFANIKNPRITNSVSPRLSGSKKDDGVFSYSGGILMEVSTTLPEKFKSATDNTGEFSTENDDIYFREGNPETDASNTKEEYKKNVQGFWNEFKEAWIDKTRALKAA